MKKNSFALLELEMADLGCFFEKNSLGPVGVKAIIHASPFMYFYNQ
jgi:hypothetical protein